MLESVLQRASTYADDIDGQIFLIAVLVGFWFLVAEGVFFWLLYKFRHREGVKSQYITGEQKHEKRWISIPHYLVLICDVLIIVGAVRVWMEVKQTLPDADRKVRIVAQQWAWTFTDAGPDGELDTDDDITTVDELHVEIGKVYHFELEARDVVHSFSVPVFRLKQDAIPGRRIIGWFEPTRTGTFDVQCAEICGIGHGIMGARMTVETAEEHAAFRGRHARTTTAGALP
jgi:cytochrome c oxidase subunit II